MSNEINIIFTENPSPEIYEKAYPVMVKNLLEELKVNGDPAQHEPCHYFIDGAYARELFIGKGQLVVGGKHKTEHFVIISQGDVSIASHKGAVRIKSPHTMVSPIGTQRVLFAHEDTVLTTIHVTDEKDITMLEKELIDGGMQ